MQTKIRLFKKVPVESNNFIDHKETHYNNLFLSNNHHLHMQHNHLLEQFDIKILDQSICACNLKDIENRMEHIKFEGNSVLKISNIYSNPYAVRKLISQLPHVINKSSNQSYYPGFIAECPNLNLNELNKIVKKAIVTYFPQSGFKVNKHQGDIIFQTGIFTQKHLISDQLPLIPHVDSKRGFAGVIYLNYPEEYNGGTAFFKKNETTKEFEYLYKNKMEFNTLILYQSETFHGFYLDTPDAFSDSFRITQRFFVTIDGGHD